MSKKPSVKSKRKTCYLQVIPQELPSGKWALMVKSFAGVNVAGPRLWRGGEMPTWEFTDLTEAEAVKKAKALQTYLENEA